MPKLLKSFLIYSLIALVLFFSFCFFLKDRRTIDFKSTQKRLIINDNGIEYPALTQTESLENFLDEQKIKIGEYDQVFPEKASRLFPGMNIEIQRAQKIKIQVDGKTVENYTLAETISQALKENGITLGRLDKVNPEIFYPPTEKQIIIVTRINVEEKIIPEDIDFKTVSKTDSKLGWREKKIEQPGEKGIREIKYRITYKNNKEISRVVLEKNITKDPIPEIVTQGTYVKIGKSSKGQGTWYAFKGGLFAASPWLPMGSYARVTNQANGKSVMVQINDRGPFGPGRIIDLDKVAFGKIASIGAGVINVKVEEVLN